MYSESMVSRSALVCSCRAPRVNSSSTLSSYHCPKSTGSKKKKRKRKLKIDFIYFLGGSVRIYEKAEIKPDEKWGADMLVLFSKIPYRH